MIDQQVEALLHGVGRRDHQLDPHLLQAACDLCLRCAADPAQQGALQRMAPEYGRAEFLLNVDPGGEAVALPVGSLTDWRDCAAGCPEAAHWFRVERGTLLAARWLCHLIGLRHRTVHLLLDHPVLRKHTVVQVRSLDKEEAPGCFDLPVAGHVVGMAGPLEALAVECREELGLSAEAFADLRQVGVYEQRLLPSPSGSSDVEHQTVYRARLTPGGWLRASAADREVAAVAVFSIHDLEAMIAAHPERVAPGLKGSFPRYGRSG